MLMKALILDSCFWEDVVDVKGLILDFFHFGRVWWSCRDWFWIISTLEGCGCPARTDFESFLLLDGFNTLEWTDFQEFPLWEVVVVLKGLISKNIYSWPTQLVHPGCVSSLSVLVSLFFYVQYSSSLD